MIERLLFSLLVWLGWKFFWMPQLMEWKLRSRILLSFSHQVALITDPKPPASVDRYSMNQAHLGIPSRLPALLVLLANALEYDPTTRQPEVTTIQQSALTHQVLLRLWTTPLFDHLNLTNSRIRQHLQQFLLWFPVYPILSRRCARSLHGPPQGWLKRDDFYF